MARTTRLDPAAWVEAAFAAFAGGGLDAVRVEGIARRLGATKGSFYWHFADRQALVEAVLTRWEHVTEQIIAEAAAVTGTPQQRLTALFAAVARRLDVGDGERLLYGQVDRPGVADVVERVTERRIGSVTALLEEMGLPPADARARAVLALSAVLGHQQLAHASPRSLGGPAVQRRTLEAALTMVLGQAPDAPTR